MIIVYFDRLMRVLALMWIMAAFLMSCQFIFSKPPDHPLLALAFLIGAAITSTCIIDPTSRLRKKP